ncbi:Tn7 transposase TnsA N-terminal domain-containing protein [Burkholderia ubonensis]|uniref:Tn7 transposase TnsA N-terminal domain-containing protein n=1 Tax=Burkholderia ubonensis TaxID=101571 RepID=UPI001E614C77|nr:Tn7 transposase TnsA N-terminal domain-containing protein [Burkholderia ubonensis]
MPSHDTRRGSNFRGFTSSVKNSCSMPWYSFPEEGTVLLLEFSPQVIRFRSAQDRTFVLGLGGQTFEYTPDYEVVRRDGSTVFIEAKLAKDLKRPSVHDRVTRARAGLAELGYPLFIWDERIYIAGTRRDTLRLLRPWRGRLSQLQIKDAKRLVEQVRPRTFRNLMHLARTRDLALAWLANGVAGIDLDAPLISEAEIYVDPSEMRHAEIFA